MSYGSILDVARDSDVDLKEFKQIIEQFGELDDDRQAQLDQVFVTAWETDLPLGIAYVRDMVKEFDRTKMVVRRKVPPLSDLGKQLIRLFAADEARGVIQRHFGVSTGFYNCCSPAIGPKGENLTNPIDQILLQDEKQRDC